MKIYFKNKYLEELAESKPKGKMRYSSEVVTMYRKKLVILGNVRNSSELRMFKSLHFEPTAPVRVRTNRRKIIILTDP